MQFPATPAIVRAHRWWKNGDFPGDQPEVLRTDEGVLFVSEGKVVRRFNHPDYPGFAICENCRQSYNAHGWIDQGESSATVCPGDWVVEYGNHHRASVTPPTISDPNDPTPEPETFVGQCRDCDKSVSTKNHETRATWVGTHRTKTGHTVDAYEIAPA